MRSVLVVVIYVLAEQGLDVAPVDNQHPIEALAPDRADAALCEAVGTRGTDRRADDPDASGTEDLVEAARELGVPVPVQELDWLGPLGQLVGQIPRLLDHPGSSRKGGHAGYEDLPAVELDEEEDVEPPEQHRVHGEEVTGQHGGGMGLEEFAPRRSWSARSGIKGVALENVPDARGDQCNAHDRELTLDPAVSPGRILSGQTDHQLNGAGRDPPTTEGFG